MAIFDDRPGKCAHSLLGYYWMSYDLLKLEGELHPFDISEIRSVKIEIHTHFIFTMRNYCIGQLAKNRLSDLWMVPIFLDDGVDPQIA